MTPWLIIDQMHVPHCKVGTGTNVAVKPNNKSRKKGANFPSVTVTFRMQLSDTLFLFKEYLEMDKVV